MVSRIARNKIALIGTGILVLVALVLAQSYASVIRAEVKALPSFIATNDSMDLAVVAGIKDTDYSTSTSFLGNVRGVVVPHHLVASRSIALGVKSLQSLNPKVIVLISPDHFERCDKLLCTTRGKFKTFFGDIDIPDDLVREVLTEKDIAEENPGLFVEEHGIYTIMPYIKHYLPDAKVVPIVLSQKGVGSERTRAELLQTAEALLSQKDTALVISSDFSHYLPLVEANDMDDRTEKTICSGDTEGILHLKNPAQSDCPLCLWVAISASRSLGFGNPSVVMHTNSAQLLHDPTVQKTTSHFVIRLSGAVRDNSCHAPDSTQKSADKQGTKILFVGDMFFDRYIRQVSEKHGEDFLFTCVEPLIRRADIVVGNLEGPITEYPSTSAGTIIGSAENYRFTFPTTTALLLAKYHVGIVNIGNNHIGNYGQEGIRSTHEILSAAGVQYFGGLSGDSPIYRTELGGERLSFVNYNQFGGDTVENVVTQISKEHTSGRIVIVYTHWGVEYASVTPEMVTAAHAFTEAGASLIVGSHPHVILPSENIGNTTTYYSLGNFIFDQYFDPRTTHGLTVMITVTNGKITTKEYPVTLEKNGQTCSTSLI